MFEMRVLNPGSSLQGYNGFGGTWSQGAPHGFQAGSSYTTQYGSSVAARNAAGAGSGQNTSGQQRLNPNPALNTRLADTLGNQMRNPGMAQADIERMVSNGANEINAGAAAQRVALGDRANAFGGGSSGGALAGQRQISDAAGVQRASNAMNTRLGAAQQAIQDRQHAMGLTDRYLGRLTDQAQSDYRYENSRAPQSDGLASLQQRAMGFGGGAAPAPASINFGYSRGERGPTPTDSFTSFTQYAPVNSGNNSLGGRDERLSGYSAGQGSGLAGSRYLAGGGTLGGGTSDPNSGMASASWVNSMNRAPGTQTGIKANPYVLGSPMGYAKFGQSSRY
jgi:hypothetical protein